MHILQITRTYKVGTRTSPVQYYSASPPLCEAALSSPLSSCSNTTFHVFSIYSTNKNRVGPHYFNIYWQLTTFFRNQHGRFFISVVSSWYIEEEVYHYETNPQFWTPHVIRIWYENNMECSNTSIYIFKAESILGLQKYSSKAVSNVIRK